MAPRIISCMLAIAVCWSVLGCSSREGQAEDKRPDTPDHPEAVQPSIVGSWIYDAGKEKVGFMKFSNAGAWELTGPLLQAGGGAVIPVKVDGKEYSVPFEATGTWKQEGDQVTVTITKTNPQTSKIVPWTYTVEKNTAKELILDNKGTKIKMSRMPSDDPRLK